MLMNKTMHHTNKTHKPVTATRDDPCASNALRWHASRDDPPARSNDPSAHSTAAATTTATASATASGHGATGTNASATAAATGVHFAVS